MPLRALLLSASAAAFFAAAATANPKRGFVGDGCKTGWTNCTAATLLTKSSWHYSYNPSDPYYATTGRTDGFVPMHWCLSSLPLPVPSYVDLSILLGMNEPNNLHNCNTAPEIIAKAWGGIMEKWPNSRLISPATAGDGRPWFDAFFANCTALYGARGCNITGLAVHDYSCTPATTMSYLQAVHERYKDADGKPLPVWLTEFSCGDGASNKPEADHLKFMKGLIPLLDAAPFVERYAWMSAVSANRGLFDPTTGKLTAVGELYESL
jgi:hypothetical protein